MQTRYQLVNLKRTNHFWIFEISKNRWEDNIAINIKEVGGALQLLGSGDIQQLVLVQTVLNHLDPQNITCG
jgi:hypothetical protein